MSPSSDVEVAIIKEQLRQLEEDIRIFRPMIQQAEEIKYTVKEVRTQLTRLEKAVEDLTREKKQREEANKKYRVAIWVAVVGLLGTFVSSTAAVISSVT